MSFLKTMNISGSALTAQRLRMDIISENLANVNTTRTAEGGPYKRKMVVFEAENQNSFASVLNGKINQGVSVKEIVQDNTQGKLIYDPTHPDADAKGYVEMSNVDTVVETIDLMAATRAFEANITAFNATKKMAMSALTIGK